MSYYLTIGNNLNRKIQGSNYFIFHPLRVFVFSGLLPCNVTEATITPKAPDPKNVVTVNGSKPGSPLPLNTGLSEVKIEVTSPDGTNKKVMWLKIVETCNASCLIHLKVVFYAFFRDWIMKCMIFFSYKLLPFDISYC